MEKQLRLNWQALIEEAKQRRKSQRLTQKRLASLSGVSTPTISRFENGEKDIQLSSIVDILTILGMIDKRYLLFPEPKPRYDFSRSLVFFQGKDNNKIIQCAITEEAMEDHLAGKNEDPIKRFWVNQNRIEYEARRKYLTNHIEANGSILVRSKDLS